MVEMNAASMETIPLEEVKKILQEKLIFSNDIIEALLSSFKYKDQLNSVILFGPAGHGKSMITTMFAEELIKRVPECKDWRIWIKTGTPTTQPKDLLGEISIEEIVKNQRIVVDYYGTSCLAYEIAIFEEAFDSPSGSLAALKDALTRGYYTVGGEKYPVKTKIFIMCTNKSVDGVLNSVPPVAQESIKAFFERAPYKHEVKWPAYGYQQWFEYLNFLFKDKLAEKDLSGKFFTKLSTLLADHSAACKHPYHSGFLSPRFATIIANMLVEQDVNGVKCLGLSIPNELKQKIIASYEDQFIIEKSEAILLKCSQLIDNIDAKINEIKKGVNNPKGRTKKERFTDLYLAVSSIVTEASNFKYHHDKLKEYQTKYSKELEKTYQKVKKEYEAAE